MLLGVAVKSVVASCFKKMASEHSSLKNLVDFCFASLLSSSEHEYADLTCSPKNSSRMYCF